MLNINIVELTGNAFALYLDLTGKRTLTTKQLENFANAVLDNLNNNNINACLSNSFDKISECIAKYPNWFSYAENNNSIILKDNISVDNLFNQFAPDITLHTMYAFFENEKILLM